MFTDKSNNLAAVHIDSTMAATYAALSSISSHSTFTPTICMVASLGDYNFACVDMNMFERRYDLVRS